MAGLRTDDQDTDMAKKKGCRLKQVKTNRMKTVFVGLCIMGTLCLQAPLALAKGTPAGTIIYNQATVTYSMAGSRYKQDSPEIENRVEELIDVSVIWQDSTDVPVNPGDTGQVLTFRVTNTGNGTETLVLTPDSDVGGGEYNPIFAGLYLDMNGNDIYDAGVDTPYDEDPVLPADGSMTVFVLNDIPVSGAVVGGDRGNSRLSATSATGAGAPGTVFETAGDDGTDAIIGASGGSAGDTGAYLVTVTVSVFKSVAITDVLGGAEPTTGAVLTYSITVTVIGSGTADGVMITDAIPVNTTYNSGTLTLNSVSLTDAADGDAGDAGDSKPGFVTVLVGDLSKGSSVQTITFDVTIN